MKNYADRKFDDTSLVLTNHAEERMNSRRIHSNDIENVVTYGRSSNIRGAVIYVIGVKEVKLHKPFGINLDSCEGIHVICSSNDSIITVYRNHDLRGLKPRSRRHWHEKGYNESRFDMAA